MTLIALFVALAAPIPAVVAQPQSPPAVAQRGMPGTQHARLAPLVGQWRVTKTSRFPGISAAGAVTSTDLTATREWVANGRFIRETVTGTMGGQPYFRTGLLGYSTMDRRYEWVTVDALNANMMIYLGERTTEVGTISMSGRFTDQGLLGEQMVGLSIQQRTEIEIVNARRNVLRLFVAPPGGKEFLADEMMFERDN